MYVLGANANSSNPDEMAHYEAFQLGLHYLPKCLFNGIKNEKDLKGSNE